MKRFEMYVKINGRYIFMGWYPIKDEDRCIDTRKKVINGHTHLYKTYQWNDSSIEEVKFIID